MKIRNIVLVMSSVGMLAACSPQTPEENAATATPDVGQAAAQAMAAEPFAIAPGLTARILRAGAGETAEAGDSVEVHYTGWLYDETAVDGRGQKFDSSLDRGQRFQFPLGAGRVIRGWDQGVAGMQIGEVRELIIAPEMAYGDRGAGNLIPPGSTLVFEVELFAARSLSE
jgi:FKBP-type peptidyl-prolyl cis-trans isomerase FkpA